MGYVKMEKLLEDVFHTDADKINGIGDIELPDFDSMLDRIEKQIEYEEEGKEESSNSNITVLPSLTKNNIGITKKIGVAMIIVTFSAALSFLFSTEKVQAFRFNIVKTMLEIKDDIITIIESDQNNQGDPPVEAPSLEESNSGAIEKYLTLEEVDKLSFHLFIPEYLPPGYKFKEMKWNEYSSGTHMLVQLYIRENMDYITITQTENLPSANMKTYINGNSAKVELLNIDGQEVTFIISDPGLMECNWHRGNSKLSINGSFNKEEVVQIIKSMK